MDLERAIWSADCLEGFDLDESNATKWSCPTADQSRPNPFQLLGVNWTVRGGSRRQGAHRNGCCRPAQ
jgi:hypothetical protein